VPPLATLAGNSGFNRDWIIESHLLNQSAITRNREIGNETSSISEQKKWIATDYFPDLKIACGVFKTGDAATSQKIKISQHYKIKPKQFVAQAAGNSMNGGKTPICDGDYLLLEWITPSNAGSITNSILVVEQTDSGSDEQYVLRKVRKKPDGSYYFQASNPDYKNFDAPEGDEMRQFARFIQVIPNEDVTLENDTN